MSIADIWQRRRRPVIPAIDEQEPRPWKLPPDLEQQLADAMDDYSGEKRAPSAYALADAIARIERELAGARQVVADSEARVVELKTQLAKQLDAEIAELQKLRPKTDDEAEATDV
jgi:hypothetical protein